MHAVVVRVTINDEGPAQEMLRSEIVPAVKQIPGFVAGYWTRSDDGSNGQSMVLFESEEGAQGMAQRLQEQGTGNDAVSLDGVEIREVVEHA